MNIIRTIAILGVAVGFSAAPLFAADEKPKRPNIEEMDADKDGALSKTELEAVTSERFKTRLLESDADKDGALSKEEFTAAKEKMKKAREEREKNGGKPPQN